MFIARLRGWTKKILWVDLSRGEVKAARYDGELASKFVGGRGLAAKLLWDYNPVGIDPLSPTNLLVFATGPLTGIPWPGSSRVVVASKSPLTRGYGDGSIGGRFG
ncbi:MAG TPA: aldehyde ferredoxin oxidoreductase, partial [Pyrodictium sp.]|nr:aldehyde ferredoxin oxidoreductase [Pyrodictium sp.]